MRTFDVEIPLHELTDSDTDVAHLVGSLLNDISDVDSRVSHGDILQALAITTAVRMAMADAAAKTQTETSFRLLDIEVGSGYEVATFGA
jgi:hypothetical protein